MAMPMGEFISYGAVPERHLGSSFLVLLVLVPSWQVLPSTVSWGQFVEFMVIILPTPMTPAGTAFYPNFTWALASYGASLPSA